jgi:hypothetical protein
MHQVAPRETVQVHRGSHREDQNGSDMGLLDLLGHQGRRREDSHPEETGHVTGSCAVVAAGAADLAERPDEAATVVPIADVSAAASQRG